MGARYAGLATAFGLVVLGVVGLFLLLDPNGVAVARAVAPVLLPSLIGGAILLVALVAGIPGRNRQLAARALAPLLVIASVAAGYVYVDQRVRLEPVAAATGRLLATVGTLPADAQIYVAVEPYGAGRTLSIDREDGASVSVATEAETWFFMIDLAPTALRGHAIRYAYLTDAGVRTSDQEWFAVVDGRPWTLRAVLDVGGHDVGVLAPAPSARKASGDALAALGAELERGRVASAADGQRKAIVVDGGDKWINVYSGELPLFLWQKLRAIEARIEMRKAADDLQGRLTAAGYDVTRFAAGGQHGALPPTAERLTTAITDAAKGMDKGELYVHVIAHGSVDGVGLWTEGNGKADFAHDFLTYKDLADTLRKALKDKPDLHITLGLDSCHSGAARDLIGDIPGVSLHTATARPDEYTPAGVGRGNPDGTGIDPNDRRTYTRAMLETFAGPYGANVETALRAADEKRKDLTFTEKRAGVPILGGSRATASPTGKPAASFDVTKVTDAIKTKWAGESYAVTSFACERGGVVQAPATFRCSFLTPRPGIGGLTLTLRADGTYSWEGLEGFYDMNYVLTILKQQWNGSAGLASYSCDTSGFVAGPATVGCNYADTAGRSGTIVIALNADGSWRWNATAAAVAPPPSTVTRVATQPPAAACDNPFANTSWSGTLALSFYGEAAYNTTIQFAFGTPTAGNCESVPVVSATTSDSSRTWRVDPSSGMSCAYHLAAPRGTGAYARCETMEFSLKLRLASGPATVGRFAIDPLSVRIQGSGNNVLSATAIRGPGGAGCCDWGTFSATRR